MNLWQKFPDLKILMCEDGICMEKIPISRSLIFHSQTLFVGYYTMQYKYTCANILLGIKNDTSNSPSMFYNLHSPCLNTCAKQCIDLVE